MQLKKLKLLTTTAAFGILSLTLTHSSCALSHENFDFTLAQTIAPPHFEMEEWKQSNVFLRALTGQWTQNDYNFLDFLGISTSQAPLNLMLSIFQHPELVIDVTDSATTMLAGQARASIRDLLIAEKISDQDAEIYFALLPDATPEELLDAGEQIGVLGSNYHSLAARLVVKSAKHSNATVEDINLAGSVLSELGDDYYELAFKMFMMAASHEKAVAEDIEESLEGIICLEQGYSDEILAISKRLFYAPDATYIYKLHAANYVAQLGADYYEEAAAMYRRLLTLYPNNLFVLETIATAFEDMGEQFANDKLAVQECITALHSSS